MYHLMCYSADFKEDFISTNQESLEGDLFGRLERYLGAPIHKAVVVETRKTLYNKNAQSFTQLQLF